MAVDPKKWLRRYELGAEIRSRLIGLLPFILGGAFLSFSTYSIVSRLALSVHGEIVEASTSCQQPHNNRCVAHYVIRNSGLDAQVVYDATPTDASLPIGLRVGDTIEKRRWRLAYRVNGTEHDDFPLLFTLSAQALVLIALRQWLRWLRRGSSV